MCSDFQTYSYKCTAREESCKLDVGFLGGVERCVALDGTLFDSIGVGQILFRKVERVCVNEPAGTCVCVFFVSQRVFDDASLQKLLVTLSAVVSLENTNKKNLKTSKETEPTSRLGLLCLSQIVKNIQYQHIWSGKILI